MDISQLVNTYMPSWVIVVLLTFASTLCMLLIKRLILGRMRTLIDRTPYSMDTVLLTAVNLPLRLVILALSVYIFQSLLAHFEVTAPQLEGLILPISKILTIAALVFFIDGCVSGLIGVYASRIEALKTSKTIVQGIARGLVIGVGLLVLLGTLGISITPIIASLGITSLAVALALQPTLENFFSGVQLVIDKPIRVGDYIELDSGEQGFVEKIGWRSTWIKMLQNNTVIMPNSSLSNSKIINYFYPQKELSVPVELGVHYDSDLDHVERVTLEVAREILKTHEWGVDDYQTFVVFTAFDNSSINFTVMLRAKEYFNRFWVRSAFIKAIHKRFNEEGIVIPFPIQALNFSQEQRDKPPQSQLKTKEILTAMAKKP